MASQCDSNDDNIIDNGTYLNFDPFMYTCTDGKQYFLSDKVDPDNNFYCKLTGQFIFHRGTIQAEICIHGNWSVLVNTFQLQKSSKQKR